MITLFMDKTLIIGVSIMAMLAVILANVAPGRYKHMCSENKKLKGCLLNSLIVKSRLSCFKECHIVKYCKSVNIWQEDVKRHHCDLNYCIAQDSDNLDGTIEKYNYFYKTNTAYEGLYRFTLIFY